MSRVRTCRTAAGVCVRLFLYGRVNYWFIIPQGNCCQTKRRTSLTLAHQVRLLSVVWLVNIRWLRLIRAAVSVETKSQHNTSLFLYLCDIHQDLNRMTLDFNQTTWGGQTTAVSACSLLNTVVAGRCRPCCVCSGPCNEAGTRQESHWWPSLHLLLPLMSTMNCPGLSLCRSVLECAEAGHRWTSATPSSRLKHQKSLILISCGQGRCSQTWSLFLCLWKILIHLVFLWSTLIWDGNFLLLIGSTHLIQVFSSGKCRDRNQSRGPSGPGLRTRNRLKRNF